MKCNNSVNYGNLSEPLAELSAFSRSSIEWLPQFTSSLPYVSYSLTALGREEENAQYSANSKRIALSSGAH